EPTSRRPAVAGQATTAPSPERLRDYQDRLRLLDERARQQAAQPPATTAVPRPPYDESAAAPPPPPDPIVEERRRREYESLFATNVVLSRRPDGKRLTASETGPIRISPPPASSNAAPAPPSIDEVADAVVRATTRVGASATAPPTTTSEVGGEPAGAVAA